MIHHPDDGGSLGVGNPVKDLIDLVRMVDRDGNGMGALKGVDPHDGLQVHGDKLLHEFQLRLDSFHTEVFHVGGKALIEPQVCPPGRSDLKRKEGSFHILQL